MTTVIGFTLAFTWGDPPTFAGMNLGTVQTFLRHGTSDPKEHTSSSAMRTNSTNFIAPTALKSRRRMARQHLLKAGPPIKIEPLDVPLRLEKRRAALLQDLAEHKRISVSRCLEGDIAAPERG